MILAYPARQVHLGQVVVAVLNLSDGIVIWVIHISVVKDDALFIGVCVDVMQVDGQYLQISLSGLLYA